MTASVWKFSLAFPVTAAAHKMSATLPADAAGDGGGPATVASPVANVLDGAADLILLNGWCQHSFRLPSGERCLVDAVVDATWARHTSFVEARRFVRQVIGTDSLINWNDKRGRKIDQVVAVLRLAAQLSESAA